MAGVSFFRALDEESEGLACGTARLGRLGHRAKLARADSGWLCRRTGSERGREATQLFPLRDVRRWRFGHLYSRSARRAFVLTISPFRLGVMGVAVMNRVMNEVSNSATNTRKMLMGSLL